MGPIVMFGGLIFAFWQFGYVGVVVGLVIALGTALTAARV